MSNESSDKRLAILFLLDVTASMTKGTEFRNRLILLNKFLEDFIRTCIQDPKIRKSAEVCFMTFADDIYLKTSFENIRWMKEKMDPPLYRHPNCGPVTWKSCRDLEGKYKKEFHVPSFSFNRDNGTNIGLALKEAVAVLENRIKDYGSGGAYPPFLILVTDGHPYEPRNDCYYEDLAAQEEAVRCLRAHSRTHHDENNLIIPLVIGVGNDDINVARLGEFAQVFEAGYFHISDADAEADWAYLKSILALSLRASLTITDLAYIDELREKLNHKA